MSKNNEHALYIEVLQNGAILGETRFPLSRSRYISIGGQGDIKLPYYESTYRLFQIKDKRTKFFVPKGSRGFVRRGADFHDIDYHNENTLSLHPGEYGKIEVQDLQVLFKVAKKIRIVKSTYNKGLRMPTPLSELFFNNQKEKIAFFVSSLLSIIITGWSLSSLMGIQDTRPKNLTELDQKYVLPNIDSRHIKNLPEAIREKLDRTNIISQSTDYAKGFAASIMDWDISQKNMISTTTNRYNSRLRSNQLAKLEEITNERSLKDQTAAKIPNKPVLSIPAVQGEPASSLISNILDKHNIQHKAFEEALVRRKEFTKNFKKEIAVDLKDTNIQKLATGATNRQALDNVSLHDKLSDEDYMYLDTLNLSKLSRAAHPENVDVNTFVMIDPNMSFTTFLENANLIANDQYIESLKAKPFIRNDKPKKRQILYGQLDPKLIESTIAQKRFELKLCYELALRRNRKAQGKMEWKWEINRQGSPQKLKLISTDIPDNRMVSCVRRKIARWSFPRPKRGKVEVTYPFKFSKG